MCSRWRPEACSTRRASGRLRTDRACTELSRKEEQGSAVNPTYADAAVRKVVPDCAHRTRTSCGGPPTNTLQSRSNQRLGVQCGCSGDLQRRTAQSEIRFLSCLARSATDRYAFAPVSAAASIFRVLGPFWYGAVNDLPAHVCDTAVQSRPICRPPASETVGFAHNTSPHGRHNWTHDFDAVPQDDRDHSSLCVYNTCQPKQI
jgi:hypothetical protein